MPVIEVTQKIWVPDIPDIELPSEDGEPLESHWHHLQINLLGDALHDRKMVRAVLAIPFLDRQMEIILESKVALK